MSFLKIFFCGNINVKQRSLILTNFSSSAMFSLLTSSDSHYGSLGGVWLRYPLKREPITRSALTWQYPAAGPFLICLSFRSKAMFFLATSGWWLSTVVGKGPSQSPLIVFMLNTILGRSFSSSSSSVCLFVCLSVYPHGLVLHSSRLW